MCNYWAENLLQYQRSYNPCFTYPLYLGSEKEEQKDSAAAKWSAGWLTCTCTTQEKKKKKSMREKEGERAHDPYDTKADISSLIRLRNDCNESEWVRETEEWEGNEGELSERERERRKIREEAN